jgi:hypothetical protein
VKEVLLRRADLCLGEGDRKPGGVGVAIGILS